MAHRLFDVDVACDRNAREALARAGISGHDRLVSGGSRRGELPAHLDPSRSELRTDALRI
jgi:hypothetical protein